MNCKRILLLFFLILLPGSLTFSDALRISQIDNFSLLINQRVKLYISVTDKSGTPVQNLNKENFTVFESTEEGAQKKRDIISVKHGVNINQGINLLLILDNSGSMYWDETGRIKDSQDESIWRITFAKNAISSLLKEIKNPLDRVGLVSFNVKMGSKIKPTNDKVAIERALTQIERPSEQEAYTELYETLYWSIDDLRFAKGRKIIIVLSDGVDFPLEENPHFPTRFGVEGAVELAQKEGISIFTIGLSKKADIKSLSYIAGETGGAHFSVYNPGELERLYNLIRDQILNEYLLIYSASMDPATQKYVKAVYKKGDKKAVSERVYFSGTIFGFPWKRINYLFFLFIPASALLLWLLSLMKFEQRREDPSLSVLTVAGRKRGRSTLVFTKRQKAVTIGGDEAADLTISGDPRIAMTEAKIVQQKGVYTITSTRRPITVNNRIVRTKVLRSGDLIKVGDTTIVFDGGIEKPAGRKNK